MKDQYAPYRIVTKRTTHSLCGCWTCYRRGFTTKRAQADKRHYHHSARQKARTALRSMANHPSTGEKTA